MSARKLKAWQAKLNAAAKAHAEAEALLEQEASAALDRAIAAGERLLVEAHAELAAARAAAPPEKIGRVEREADIGALFGIQIDPRYG